jgi:hypothetical protein
MPRHDDHRVGQASRPHAGEMSEKCRSISARATRIPLIFEKMTTCRSSFSSFRPLISRHFLSARFRTFLGRVPASNSSTYKSSLWRARHSSLPRFLCSPRRPHPSFAWVADRSPRFLAPSRVSAGFSAATAFTGFVYLGVGSSLDRKLRSPPCQPSPPSTSVLTPAG